MSDDTETTEPDAPAATGTDEPQAGTDDAPDGVADTPSLSPEDARKLRSEAANLRKRLKANEEELTKLKDGELSERQKLERDKTALEAKVSQLESSLRDKTVQAVAAKVGVKADLIDTVAPLIDWDDVDADDTKVIEKAVKELVKDRPSLSGKPDGLDGGAGRGSGRSGAGGEPTLTDMLVSRVDRR